MEKLSSTYNSIIQTRAGQFGLEHFEKPIMAVWVYYAGMNIKNFCDDLERSNSRVEIILSGIQAVASAMYIIGVPCGIGIFGRVTFIPKLICATEVLRMIRGFEMAQKLIQDNSNAKRCFSQNIYDFCTIGYKIFTHSFVIHAYFSGRNPSYKMIAILGYGGVFFVGLLKCVFPIRGSSEPELQTNISQKQGK